MGTRLGNEAKIGNVYSLFQGSLVRRIEYCIERNVFQHLVNPEFVRIEDHVGEMTGKRNEPFSWGISRVLN
jgi:hypothetical protein